MQRTFFVVAALVAAFFVPATAEGHAVACGDRDALVEALDRKLSQKRVAFGVTDLGGLIEVFATDDGRKWTLVSSRPNTMACILATGQGWREIKQVVGDPS